MDLRQGVRMLGRDPAFTALAVLTLALGIGATTAIFSVIDGVLLRSLPYHDPDTLVMLRADRGRAGLEGYPALSVTEVDAFERESELFSGLGRVAGHTIGLTAPGSMEQVPAVTVSPELLEVLGVQPMLGRNFDHRADHHANNGAFPSVLISHELWQRRYGGDANIVGRRIDVYNVGREVIGVMPPGFRLLLGPGTNVEPHNDVWIPAARDPTWNHVRAWKTIGRLQAGATPEQAGEELNAIGRRVREQYFPETEETAFRVIPLRHDLASGIRHGIWILFVASVLVLLIGCVNIANLQLARGVGRRGEFAVRGSLGASRGRILRQVVTENLVLGLLGGVAGALVAWVAIRALRFLPVDLPRGDEVALNGAALAFALVASVVAGTLFGLIPAWQACRSRRQALLPSAGGGIVGRRLRGGLLIAEVAVSLVLLVGAGLLVRTMIKLGQVDLGFDPRNLLTLRVSVDAERFPEASQRRELHRRILAELGSIPGVTSVGGIRRLPMQGTRWATGWALVGESREQFLTRLAGYDWVLPGYFEAMAIRLHAGRVFDGRDHEGERRVVVVDRELARRAWPGEEAVGKELLVKIEPDNDSLQKAEVVGVVSTVRSDDLRRAGEPNIYFPFGTYSGVPTSHTMVLRTSGDPLAVATTAVERIDRVGPGRPVFAVQPMDAYVSAMTAETRFQLILLGALALAALILSSVGAFGVIAHTVSQRTREIGIRMALGAHSREILVTIVGQGMKASVIGVLLGLLAALAMSRSLELLLFDVAPRDPLTLIAVSLLLVAVTLVACYLPARRATRVEPTVALRHE